MTRGADPPEAAGVDAALSAARPLGALQEARRLRSPVVGTEHPLMATMTDPVVRWAVTRAGRDLSPAARSWAQSRTTLAAEQWGTGFDRHLDEALAAGHPGLEGVDRATAEALIPRLR